LHFRESKPQKNASYKRKLLDESQRKEFTKEEEDEILRALWTERSNLCLLAAWYCSLSFDTWRFCASIEAANHV
jgi:hypothetical protein